MELCAYLASRYATEALAYKAEIPRIVAIEWSLTLTLTLALTLYRDPVLPRIVVEHRHRVVHEGAAHDIEPSRHPRPTQDRELVLQC